MAYTHQNWETIILNPKKAVATTIVGKKTQGNGAAMSSVSNKPAWKIEQQVDMEGSGKPMNFVTKEDASAIIAGRVAMKLSQKDLAQRLNMPEKEIKDIETCKAVENKGKLAKIKKFLNIK